MYFVFGVLLLSLHYVDAHRHTHLGVQTPETIAQSAVHEAGDHAYRCTHNPSHIKATHVDDIAHSKRLHTESTAGVRRPMKFSAIAYNDAAGTSAKAVYLRDRIMPAVQKILSEIFTVETWDNSILNTDECTIDSTTLALPGVSGGDEDFYLMYDMYNLGSSGTIAKAGACYILTSNSRPIVGIAAFDPDYVGPDSSYSEDGQIKVALHEVFHAIGFSGSSFPGLTTATTRGKTRNFIASATVLAKAKEQAGCDSLKGAELEDEGGSGTAGSHFEERVYGNELMTGIVNTRTMKVSSLSLAVMEDSGWSYVADYNKADTLFWGKEKGCSFHDDFCLTLGSPQTTVSESTFPVLVSGDTVNSRGYSKYGCTMGREYKGVATAYYLASSVLPTDYQYYSEDTNTRRGNGNIYMEYCPYYSAEEAYSSSFAQTNEAAGNCRATVDLGANAAKEVYGANSRCFMVSDGKPYCFEYGTLAASNMTMIKVAGATEFSNCTCTKCDGTDGTTTVVSGGITITCPPVSEIYGQSPNWIDPNLAAFVWTAQPSPQPSSSPPRYGPDGDLCPAGFSLSADVCSPCPVGTFSTVPGRTMCFDCAAGTYSVRTGATECALCPENTYSMTEKASKCMFCAAGYGSTSGSMSCTKCPAGTFSPGGGVPCSPCVPGSYAAMEGMSFCLPCAAGTESAAAGSTSCSSCSA